MLSYIVDTIVSTIAVFAICVAKLRIFLRLSSLDFSVRIDMVLFTLLKQCSFRYSK